MGTSYNVATVPNLHSLCTMLGLLTHALRRCSKAMPHFDGVRSRARALYRTDFQPENRSLEGQMYRSVVIRQPMSYC